MRSLTIHLLVFAISLAGGPQAYAQDHSLSTRWSLQPTFQVAIKQVIDLRGDGKEELVLIGTGGEVRHWRPQDSGTESKALRGSLNLPDPAYSLVAIGSLTPNTPPKLVVFSPRGVVSYGLIEGVFGGQGQQLLSSRIRFTLRTGQPQVSTFMTDVNGDQRLDFVIPGTTHCSVYLNKPSENSSQTSFTLTSRIENEIDTRASQGSEALSSNLSASIQIPDLQTADVNGDGRQDLVATKGERNSYHMQRADGSFPEKPDVVLNLNAFRDTTPKSKFRLGQTIATNKTTLRTRDLTDDGIPDHVIIHRRKVWVFHASKNGPQFTKPASILKTAEDISFALLVHLNDDPRPDLLLFRVEAPSIATLLAALVMQWNIDIEGIGYQTTDLGAFSRQPTWRSTTTLRAPGILDLLSKIDGIVEQFQDASEKFRHAVEADLDGNAKPDVLLQTEDHTKLEFWLDTAGITSRKGSTEQQIREFVFEDKNRIWDLDRILGLMRNTAASRQARLTKGGPPSGFFALRDPENFQLDFAVATDLDGDKRQEIVLRYRAVTNSSQSVFDVVAFEK
jgi:hypothetical protein